MERRMSDTVLIKTRSCMGCGAEPETYEVPASAVEQYKAGAYIQVAFPMLTTSQRERIISGTCQACWDRMWGEDDDL